MRASAPTPLRQRLALPCVWKRTYSGPLPRAPYSMKTKSLQPAIPAAPGSPLVSSSRDAAALLEREIADLREWLAAQGLDLESDTAHADEGSRDRLYWRYGYFVGLKHAQAILTSRGATLH